MRKTHILFPLLLAATSAQAQTTAQTPAQTPAPACGPLTGLAAIDLLPVPGDGRFLVPTTINGAPQKFLLTTAGGLITINQAAAKALNLAAHDSDKRVLDVNGFASRRYVVPDDFSIAGVHVRHTFALTPDPSAGNDPANDGVFDASLNHRLDVELDFANHKLAYFSPNHCPGHVIYWKAEYAGVIPLTVTARTDDRARHGDIGGAAALMSATDSLSDSEYFLSLADTASGITGSDIRIKVMLDGKEFTANIDTSLEYSTLNSGAANARFDVTDSSPGSMPVTALVADDPNRQGAAGASETVTVYGTRAFAHTFHTLSFGGVTVTAPRMLVRPDRTGTYDRDNDVLTGSRVYRMDDNVLPDISIGMDILSKLHLYFAFAEKKLYVTAAGSQTASN